MVGVVGYFASRDELNESPVAFNEEVLEAMPSGANLIFSPRGPDFAFQQAPRLTQAFHYA